MVRNTPRSMVCGPPGEQCSRLSSCYGDNNSSVGARRGFSTIVFPGNRKAERAERTPALVKWNFAPCAGIKVSFNRFAPAVVREEETRGRFPMESLYTQFLPPPENAAIATNLLKERSNFGYRIETRKGTQRALPVSPS